MPILLVIRHSTTLSYSSDISESVIEMRVTPRNDERPLLRDLLVEVSPTAEPLSHCDWLGNTVH